MICKGYGIASTVAFFCALGGDAALPRAGAIMLGVLFFEYMERWHGPIMYGTKKSKVKAKGKPKPKIKVKPKTKRKMGY